MKIQHSFLTRRAHNMLIPSDSPSVCPSVRLLIVSLEYLKRIKNET